MAAGNVSAEVISCPGRLGDAQYTALQVNVEGFNGPYVLTLAMPAIGFRALSDQVDPVDLYSALAHAINLAGIDVEVRRRGALKPKVPAGAAAA